MVSETKHQEIQGLSSCVQPHLENIHNLLWPLTPLRGYSNAEGILATSSITPLLVNIGSMTAKPRAGGAGKTASHV